MYASGRWRSNDVPGAANIKELSEYLNDGKKYSEFRNTVVGEYFLEIIEGYEQALNDEWLPFEIISLELPQAKEFIGKLISLVSSNGLERSVPLLREEYEELRIKT